MTKVYIDLDYECVAQAIKAKVPAAVDDILRRYDLQRMIEKAITDDTKPKKTESRETSWSRFSFSSFVVEPKSPRERFEATLNGAINAALETAITEWLKSNPEMFRAAVERAMPQALANIKLKLVDNESED